GILVNLPPLILIPTKVAISSAVLASRLRHLIRYLRASHLKFRFPRPHVNNAACKVLTGSLLIPEQQRDRTKERLTRDESETNQIVSDRTDQFVGGCLGSAVRFVVTGQPSHRA